MATDEDAPPQGGKSSTKKDRKKEKKAAKKQAQAAKRETKKQKNAELIPVTIEMWPPKTIEGVCTAKDLDDYYYYRVSSLKVLVKDGKGRQRYKLCARRYISSVLFD